MEQLNRVRNQSMAETQTVVEGMQRDISAHLTPEQRTKFEQMNRELREAREAREKAEREKRMNLDRPLGDKPPAKPPGN
jgi:UDP-N-acetyl-D-mannosaminuronate dehydrogenase